MGASMLKTRFFTSIALLAVAGAPAALAQPRGRAAAVPAPAGRPAGGTVNYWMSAETTSGLAAAMGGQPGAGGAGARPSIMGALLRGGRGAAGGPRADAYIHNLHLELGSPRRAAGAPTADHFIPTGLNAGASLPLASPEPNRPVPTQPHERPGGGDGGANARILFYWGCGEHARPGQPYEIDTARLRAGQVPPAMAQLAIRAMTPPNQASAATFGEWPNQRSRVTIPASGSLVGAHSVRGNYSPDINFTLAPGQDFLAPITITQNSPAPSRAVPLGWQQVPNALGYFIMATGAAENNTIIIWTSSEAQMSQMGAFDYLPPAEVARLVQQRVLLAPTTTQCTVPVEVAGRVQAASLMMTAFGPEANFSSPQPPARMPRGWAPDWTVKLRTRSAYMGMLGQDLAAMMRGESGDRQQQEPRRRRNPLGRIFGQ
jgi:hypothetical protein